MTQWIRLAVAAALLLPGFDRAAAAALVSASAAAAKGAMVAPVPTLSSRLNVLRQAGSRTTLSGSPRLTSTLASVTAPRHSVAASGLVRAAALGSAAAAPSAFTAAWEARSHGTAAFGSLPLPPMAAAREEEGHNASGAARSGLERTARDIKPILNKDGGIAAANGKLSALFDGIGRFLSESFVSEPQDLRPPDWREDARIDSALRRLSQSKVGADLYRYVYENHGSNLSIVVDDASGADYEARLVWRDGKPVVQLTEKLVDNQSAEVVAAYIARELSEIYLKDFPESADRNYMAFSSMVRTFAELTNSGLASYRYWWDRARDQRSGDAWAMERIYGSWKEAVRDGAYNGKAVRDSAFFTFLANYGGDNMGPDSRLSLRQLYDQGRISRQKFREMNDYFSQFLGSEQSWMTSTGRW